MHIHVPLIIFNPMCLCAVYRIWDAGHAPMIMTHSTCDVYSCGVNSLE